MDIWHSSKQVMAGVDSFRVHSQQLPMQPLVCFVKGQYALFPFFKLYCNITKLHYINFHATKKAVLKKGTICPTIFQHTLPQCGGVNWTNRTDGKLPCLGCPAQSHPYRVNGPLREIVQVPSAKNLRRTQLKPFALQIGKQPRTSGPSLFLLNVCINVMNTLD